MSEVCFNIVWQERGVCVSKTLFLISVLNWHAEPSFLPSPLRNSHHLFPSIPNLELVPGGGGTVSL